MAMKAGCLQPAISPFRSRRRKSRLGPPTDSMSIISCGQVTLMRCFHLRSRQCSATAPFIEGEAPGLGAQVPTHQSIVRADRTLGLEVRPTVVARANEVIRSEERRVGKECRARW